MNTVLLLLIPENALSKTRFPVGTGIDMLPSNLNLNIRKTVGYDNKILVSNTDMKISLNKDINKAVVYYKKSPVTPTESNNAEGAAHSATKMYLVKSTDNPIKDRLRAQHDQITLFNHNRKMLAKKHNDEKLAITLLIIGAGLIYYHFW